jgi:amino acid adenylation domain-containing protein
MLEDSGARVVVADDDLEHLGLDDARVLRLDRPERHGAPAPITGRAAAEDAAYLIYTSGSTGRPKGVRVPHRAVVSFLETMRRVPGLGPGDRLVAVTTLSFDIAVLELLLPLAVGAEIVLATREQVTDGAALRALLESSRATVMQATPATWRLLTEAGWSGPPGFRALCGGEALPGELAESLLERTAELWNMYGPTETTVWSTCGRVDRGAPISIGRPIGNTQVWILDGSGEVVPIGVPGEIHIAGDGVALGYHRRPELDAERFVPDPFSRRPGALMYRTGDLGRWRADGTIQHLGRTDFQVKVRGYRIELGEIEVALAAHPAVAQAIVTARPGPGGENRLVGYVVARAARPPAAELRDHLRARLPDYMVPALFVFVDAMPLTPNGKVDRRALPDPAAVLVPSRELVAPRTATEKLVAEVWRELLEVPQISVGDNFLDLGGHSLLILRAIAVLEKRTGKRLNPGAFIFQTLEQVARDYDSAGPERRPPPPTAPAGSRLVKRLFSALGRGKD